MAQLRRLFPALLLTVVFLAASCGTDGGAAPAVTVSPERVPDQGHVDVQGTGFTPNANVTSHLRRPDGSEFPFLPILTDDQGEFTHDIDTLLLDPGIHELWVVDDATGVSSNVARFEVTKEVPRAP